MIYLAFGAGLVLGGTVGVILAAADFCSRWERECGGYVDLTHLPTTAGNHLHVTVRKLP
jgi:hypothetical protein